MSVARNERGVALMLVLWLIVVLGAVATGVASKAHESLAIARTARTRSSARYAAESGVVAARARLEELYQESTTPEARASAFARFEDEITQLGVRALGGTRYQVTVTDLGSRIDLNQAGPPVLIPLLREIVGERDAQVLANALLDWKDEDRRVRPGGAEGPQYAATGSPFVPPNGPLLRLDELTRVLGFADSVVERLAPYITVRGNGRVNLNTAPHPVLAAVPELGPAGAAAVIAARRGGSLLTSDQDVRALFAEQGMGTVLSLRSLTTVADRVLVVSRGWQEGSPLTHEIQAVLQLRARGGDSGPEWRVVHWTERDL